MKKIIIVCGLIAGLIVTSWMLLSITNCYSSDNYAGSMLLGYASMLVAFSMVFVGVKNYRDKHNGGVITFGQAFKIGGLIALIASTIYVLVWMIDFYFFIPDFYEKYSAHIVHKMQQTGASAAAIQKQIADDKVFAQQYKNPFFNAMITYCEILPPAILMTLLAAFILKRKPKQGDLVAV